MKVKEAELYIGKRVFYKSKSKKSGAQVVLQALVGTTAVVHHIDSEFNRFTVHPRDLCPSHPLPHAEVFGAFQKADVEPIGLCFAVGDRHLYIYWKEEPDDTGPGKWVIGEHGKVVIESYDDLSEAMQSIEELFNEVE